MNLRFWQKVVRAVRWLPLMMITAGIFLQISPVRAGTDICCNCTVTTPTGATGLCVIFSNAEHTCADVQNSAALEFLGRTRPDLVRGLSCRGGEIPYGGASNPRSCVGGQGNPGDRCPSGLTENVLNLARRFPATTAPAQNGANAGTGATDLTGTTPGTTTPPAAASGTCTFNCTPQIPLPCTSDSECQTQCNDHCGGYVTGSTCSTTPAPSCNTTTHTCAFNCAVTPAATCTVGDAGDNQCGSRCAAACAPPSGSPTRVLCSGTIQARCNAPAGTGTGPVTTGGANTTRSASNGDAGTASYALENPIAGTNTIPDVIGKAIKALMGIIGAIALFMFVYGGIRWILAAGDQKAIGEASEVLKNASIGLLIIFLSYTIITVGMGLVNELAQRGTPESTGTSSSTPAPTRSTTPAPTTQTPAPTGDPTARGRCVCSPSIPVDAIRLAASAAQLTEMESRCRAAPANGTFDSTNLVCTGNSTRTECSQVQTGINQSAGFDVAACVWTAP